MENRWSRSIDEKLAARAGRFSIFVSFVPSWFTFPRSAPASAVPPAFLARIPRAD